MSVLAYNLLMSIAVVAAIVACARRRERRRLHVAFALVALAAGVLALGLGGNVFGLMGLLAWGIFLHLTLLQIALAALAWKPMRGTALLLALRALVLVAIAIDAFLIEPHWLEITRHSMESAKVARPMRIVVIADLQTDRVGDYERSVLAAAMAERPDLILLPGDYIQVRDPVRRQEQRAELRRALHEAGLAAPLGIFAVGGNVDAEGWESSFDGLEARVAPHSQTFEGELFQVTALDLVDSFDPEIRVASTGGFHIVLGHCPDFALGDVRADLCVAGHCHGGQVRLPLLGPLVTFSRVPRAWTGGDLVALPGGGRLLVSRGIGMERGRAPRLRFLCRPQLVVIDVQPAQR